MEIRIAGIDWESVVDGPGVRTVIFGQGCLHRCRGCHNQHTWDQRAGLLWKSEELIQKILKSRTVRGVTLSGGEPFLQARAFGEIAQAVRQSGLEVITYTGYTLEEIVSRSPLPEDWQLLLLNSDYLIDGPFILENRDLSLPYRGSTNQRIIDVERTQAAGAIVEVQDLDAVAMRSS